MLFLEHLNKWAADKGLSESLKTELLPVSGDGHPRVRLACPPAMLEDIRAFFWRKIRHVDEIPLPEPSAQKKSIWKLIFGG
jgi:hypothetical protein